MTEVILDLQNDSIIDDMYFDDARYLDRTPYEKHKGASLENWMNEHIKI